MKEKSCEFCRGTGQRICDECSRGGMIIEAVNSRAKWFAVSRTTTCRKCKGNGRIICHYCNGTGKKIV